jgi:hypothetical protein
MPIMLDNNGDNNRPDAEFDATTSDDDDDRTLGATPPADEDHHASVAAISIEPVANGQSRGSATDSVSSGRPSLSDRNVKSEKVNGMVQSQPSTYRQRDRSPSSLSSESAGGPKKETSYIEVPAAAGNIHHVFAEYEKKFGVDSLTRKSTWPKGRG